MVSIYFQAIRYRSFECLLSPEGCIFCIFSSSRTQFFRSAELLQTPDPLNPTRFTELDDVILCWKPKGSGQRQKKNPHFLPVPQSVTLTSCGCESHKSPGVFTPHNFLTCRSPTGALRQAYDACRLSHLIGGSESEQRKHLKSNNTLF